MSAPRHRSPRAHSACQARGPTASRHFKLDRQRGCSCRISLFLGHLASVSHPVLAMDCRFPSKASVSLISPSSEPARVCSGIYPAPRRPSLSDGQTPLGASCKTWRSTPDPSRFLCLSHPYRFSGSGRARSDRDAGGLARVPVDFGDLSSEDDDVDPQLQGEGRGAPGKRVWTKFSPATGGMWTAVLRTRTRTWTGKLRPRSMAMSVSSQPSCGQV